MAMLYTPQQMAGGPGFSKGVRLGNWNEDVALQEARAAEFLVRRERGELLLSKVSAKQARYLQPVPHAYSEDGHVRFGDTVILRHLETGAALATDPQDKIHGEDVAVTGQPRGDRAVARNTVVILPVRGRDGAPEGSTLTYGQSFHLSCNPSLRVDEEGYAQEPLYLASHAATPTTGRKAPLTGHQQVCMTLSRGSETVWFVRPPNVGLVGSPVAANEEAVIVHRNTNQALALDRKAAGNTDFGREFEICCHTFRSKRRPLPMSHPAADLGASVPVEEPNLWRLETSRAPSAAEDRREFRRIGVEDVLERIRRVAAARGAHGIRGMGRAFRAMDDHGDGTLDRADFKYGLRDMGIALPDELLAQVIDAYDRNGDGVISFDEFIRGLRGEMNDRRRALVNRAYDVLDATGDGRVTLEDVEMRYNANLHPDVVSGRRTAREILYEFMAEWEGQERDGVVTRAEFENYYADVSACIDDDDYFELMIKNAWHIVDDDDAPAGDATANTSNLRVLVTHYNGMQEVVTVKDDLGLDKRNVSAVIERLKKQGVTDIMTVETA